MGAAVKPNLTAITVALLLGGCVSPRTEPPERADAPPPWLRSGRLGHPLGTYVTIEGVRAERGKVGVKTLTVDRINGQDTFPPIRIWIENVEELPEGTRCTLNGYESGKMIGLPKEVAEAENIPIPQATWQFYRYFLVTSVVEPKGLPWE